MESSSFHKIITSKPDGFREYAAKIWSFKLYIYIFLLRDLKLKYAQTSLGITWTIIQPVLFLIIYTVFFSLILDMEHSYPYVLFVMSGLMIWNLSISIITNSSSSFYQNTDLIKKVYFPKILLPLSKVASALVDFVISLLLFIILLFYYQFPVGYMVVLFPLLLISLVCFSLGFSLIVTALTLKKRDLLQIIPFIVSIGIWLTPVFYTVTIIPEPYKSIIYLNPIASVIQLTRVILFNDPIEYFSIGGIVLSFLVFAIGIMVFKKVEDYIVDRL